MNYFRERDRVAQVWRENQMRREEEMRRERAMEMESKREEREIQLEERREERKADREADREERRVATANNQLLIASVLGSRTSAGEENRIVRKNIIFKEITDSDSEPVQAVIEVGSLVDLVGYDFKALFILCPSHLRVVS
jgi:hypothetical protein